MRLPQARKLNQLLRTYAASEPSHVVERWPIPNRQLDGFHQWADARHALGAYLVGVPNRDRIWLVLVDWKRSNNFYLVLFPESRSGPIAEIHRCIDGPTGSVLHWTYSPSIRDGRNEQRRAYFENAFGSRDVYLQMPIAIDEVEDLIDESLLLADCRKKADDLAIQGPVLPPDGFPEGRLLERLHVSRERKPALIRMAKEIALSRDGRLRCACCNFDFEEAYGDIGRGFIEAHHTKPVSTLSTEGEVTRVEDLVLVCSNCHRMLHRRRPWLGPTELRTLRLL